MFSLLQFALVFLKNMAGGRASPEGGGQPDTVRLRTQPLVWQGASQSTRPWADKGMQDGAEPGAGQKAGGAGLGQLGASFSHLAPHSPEAATKGQTPTGRPANSGQKTGNGAGTREDACKQPPECGLEVQGTKSGRGS